LIIKTDDKKHKYQSCETLLTFSYGGVMDYITFDLAAWGSTEQESMDNFKVAWKILKDKVDNLVAKE
jgi:hypothetical protein